MKVTDRLLVKCISPDGASLTTYTTYRCGDGCCSERDSERVWFACGTEVEVNPSTHTWDGYDLDDFALDGDEWEVIEYPSEYSIEKTWYGCTLKKTTGENE